MTRRLLLFWRLLERRLLGDGERTVSLIPGAFTTLALSSIGFALLAAERGTDPIAPWLFVVVIAWTALRAFLDAREVVESRLDRAVLTPLPIPPRELALAHAAVESVFLVVAALNVALPPVVILACATGAREAAIVLSGAFVATLVGHALGQSLRALLIRTLGTARLQEWEGPIRLLVAVSLFAALIAAPDPSVLVERAPWLSCLPPFSLVGMLVGDVLYAAAAVFVAAALLFLTAGSAAAADEVAPPSGSAGPWRAAFRAAFVREDERAGYDFAMSNMRRDRGFRAKVYPLFAFPFAVAVLLIENPERPGLVLLALFGVPVYLSLARIFFEFTESEGGPELLRTLPMRDEASFRAGAEKAFIAGLLLPIYALLLSTLLWTAALVAPEAIAPLLAHCVHAVLFAVLLVSLLFRREGDLPFSKTDRGVYPADLGSEPYLVLFVSAALGAVSASLSGRGGASSALAAILAALVFAAYSSKGRAPAAKGAT